MNFILSQRALSKVAPPNYTIFPMFFPIFPQVNLFAVRTPCLKFIQLVHYYLAWNFNPAFMFDPTLGANFLLFLPVVAIYTAEGIAIRAFKKWFIDYV